MFAFITPVTYWILILLWTFILYFYVKKMWSSKTQRLFSALVLILAIDAFRTLFESVYFGLWYTSLSGIISPKIGALLTRPELVIIPKILNVIAAVVVILLLLRKWLPREEKEQERAAEVLQESENRYYSLFANNHSVMLLIDPENSSIVDANLAACSYYGYSLDQLTGMHVFDIILFSDEGTFREMAKAKSENRKNVPFQHKLASGEIRDVEVYSGPITLAGKQLIYAIIHDVTERKAALQAVETSARQYHGMLQSTMDGFWNVDKDGMIVDVNNTICKMLGYTRDQLLTMSIVDVDVEENDEDVRQHIEKIVTTGYDRFESRHKRKDGTVLDVEVSSTYIPDPNAYFCTFIRDITERKKTDEIKNRILEASIGGIYIYDLNLGRNIYINRQYTTLTGYTLTDISSMNYDEFASLFHPEDQEKVFGHIRVLTEDIPDNSNLHIDYRFKCATGGWKWFRSCDAVYDRDTNGKVRQLIGTFIDISDHKKSEESLKESEERFRKLSGATFEAIVFHDNGVIVHANDQYYKMFGYTPEELAGIDAISKTSTSDSIKHINHSISSGNLGPYEVMGVKKDGTEFPIEIRIKVSEFHSPNIRVAAIRDLTEQKKTEDELQESRKYYQALFNKNRDGYVINKGSGELLDPNPAYAKMLGYSVEETKNLSFWEITPEKWIKWEANYQGKKLLERGYSDLYEKEYIHRDGTIFPVEVQAFLLNEPKDLDSALIGAFVRDITKQKKAEREKENIEKRLNQAQKMEAIGTLAGGIAHDFNNILAAILGYAEMAKDDCQPGSTISGDLDEVLKAGNRAKKLVQQILAFSRQDDAERIPLQPASILKEVVKMLRASLPTTIEIDQDISYTTGLILADPSQVHQILMNLCTNAYHAMEETGGKIHISLKEANLSADDLVHEPNVEPGTFVQLSISDSGPGIAPDIEKNIFDPYFTTKEAGKGTGMGLAIVHGIVKSYGGFISLYSEPGEGTVFHVFLPVIQQELLPEIEVAEPSPIGRERILFIDDEELLAKMGKSMLERLGYHVTVRNNSIEALETFKNQPDQFDVVITDQTMPGMTGADIARRMIQVRPDIPIILCTGYSSVISEEKAKSLGIKEFALKPISKKDIAVLIRKVLDNS